MAKYNKLLADSSNTVMLQVSLDRSKDAAENWAAKAKLPWYHILPEKVENSKLRQFKKTKFVPEYNLIDKEGKIIASGSNACFVKIKELSEK